MSRCQAVFLHLANVLVAGTGLVYAWMRYLLQPVDEWAVVNHPWQPLLQHLHVLAAPSLVFAMGLIWSAHVLGKLKNGRKNRAAGVGLTALFLPMAASGYLLQVAVDPEWRRRWVWIHVASSLLWVAAFAVHQLRAIAVRRADQSGTEASAISRIGNSQFSILNFELSARGNDQADWGVSPALGRDGEACHPERRRHAVTLKSKDPPKKERR